MQNPTTPRADTSVPAAGLLWRFIRRGWTIEHDRHAWVATRKRGSQVRVIADHDARALAAKLTRAESEVPA